MSEIRDRVDALIESERTPGLFIHSIYDDLPLTVDGFRLLCHLSRRSDNDSHIAQTTYEKMGEVCFRATYPRSTAAALRKRAMAAMKELINFGLVRVEATTGWDGGQGANKYILTHCSAWRPEYQPGPGTTARLARVSPETPPQSAGADPPPVRWSGPPQSVLADPPSPLERTHKDILIEGNPYRRIDPVGLRQEKTETDPSIDPFKPDGQLSLLSQNDLAPEHLTDPEPNVPPPSSQKKKAKTKSKTSKYYPEQFAEIYEEYRQFAKVTSPSIARNQSPSAAAEVWDNLIASGDALEAILEGVRWYIQQEMAAYKRGVKVFGVAHFFRYLKDRRWEAAYEDKQEEQAKHQSSAVQTGPAPVSRLDEIRAVRKRMQLLLSILRRPAVLPDDWQQRTGKIYTGDMSHEDAIAYCEFLAQEHQAMKAQAG